MSNNPDIFSQEFSLPYSALTIGNKVKMDWLFNVFQDAASAHCHTHAISGFDMAQKNLKWVVAQYRIKIHKSIDWMTPLVVQTWRAPWKNLYEVRQFRLLDKTRLSHDNPFPLVSASSIWILIKASNNRPVRLLPNMPPDLMQNPLQKAIQLLKPDDALAKIDHECIFPVHFLDLDLNEHVNNRIYVRWAVESMPGTLNFEYSAVACDVIYQKETLPKDTVQIQVSINFDHDLLHTEHVIVRQASKEKLAHLMLTWEKTDFKRFLDKKNDL